MDAAACWRLFQCTGAPAYYLWYCRLQRKTPETE